MLLNVQITTQLSKVTIHKYIYPSVSIIWMGILKVQVNGPLHKRGGNKLECWVPRDNQTSKPTDRFPCVTPEAARDREVELELGWGQQHHCGHGEVGYRELEAGAYLRQQWKDDYRKQGMSGRWSHSPPPGSSSEKVKLLRPIVLNNKNQEYTLSWLTFKIWNIILISKTAKLMFKRLTLKKQLFVYSPTNRTGFDWLINWLL